MTQLFFDKNELQIIESLLEAANVIDKIYENLYNLEINGQCESEDYQKLLKALEEAKKIENARIKQANIDYEKAIKFTQLLQNTPKWNKKSNLNCTMFQQYDDRVIRRIINIFNFKIKTSINYQKKQQPKEIIEFIKAIGEKEDDFFKDRADYEKLNFAVNDDIEFILILILSEYTSNTAYSNYKNQLIKSKYYIAFINRNIEDRLLKQNFNLSQEIAINSILIASILERTTDDYESIKTLYMACSLIPQIYSLLSITDNDYEMPTKNIESILRQCYIRAILSLLTEEEAEIVKEKFLNTINNSQYLKRHTSAEISENIINCCFTCKKFDSNKVKIRTLSYTKPQEQQ